MSAIAEASLSAENQVPDSVGIDAPLYWVDGGEDRFADYSIRKRVCKAGGVSGNVSHVNSLRGACLVQGILTVRHIAETWPTAKITEAHPKALLLHSDTQQFLHEYLPSPKTEHERDALLAAYSAWAFAEKRSGWDDLVCAENDPFFPSGHKIAYWFPC